MIAIDWGTSSFRAWRLDGAGAVVAQRNAAAGLNACNGAFEAVLEAQLDGWDDAVVVMAGMIGSRSGWREVPYVVAPAGLESIAAGIVEIDAKAMGGRRVFIVPGVSQVDDSDAPPEVMRGEETQLMGLTAEQPAGSDTAWVCLPGTHSKWVTLCDGRIECLRTAMTGELYALLRGRSLLAALMPPEPADDIDDEAAFVRGVTASARDGGVANHLFGVRTLGLFGHLARDAAPSYLSGLLIGHELRGLLPPSPGVVHLVGGAALARRYERALALLGVASQSHGEALAARGLHRLAQARGLPL
jgi:2-dehydro-3-deoxygalactonokinase